LYFKKRKSFEENDIESILEACLHENPIAQRALIKMFFNYAKSISNRYASNSEEAEEIINDSFHKVFTNLSKYDHSQQFKAWFRAIIIHTAIDSFRKNHKFSLQTNIDHFDFLDITHDVIDKISAEEILKLVQELPPSYRMVFSLFAIDGYSHSEIADMLGIKEGTSKSNLQDARKKLQSMIKKEFPSLCVSYSINTERHNER